MKLTSRDKILLYIMTIVIILVVGIKFIIFPMAEKYSTSNEKAAEVIIQAKSIEIAVNDLESKKSTLNNNKEEFTNLTKDYLEYMSIKDITNYMNDFTLTHGLTTNSFSATDIERFLGEDSGLLIYSSTINFEVKGSYDNLIAFINSAYENKALLVSYFNIISDGTSLSGNDVGTMEIEIMIFMYDNRWSE